MVLDYASAHNFVEKTKNASWDGWTIEIWRPDRNGIFKRNGARRNNKWGVVKRVSVSNDGLWRI